MNYGPSKQLRDLVAMCEALSRHARSDWRGRTMLGRIACADVKTPHRASAMLS